MILSIIFYLIVGVVIEVLVGIYSTLVKLGPVGKSLVVLIVLCWPLFLLLTGLFLED